MQVVKKALHRVAVNILFPATLGAIFIDFIAVDFVRFFLSQADRFTVYPRLIFGVVFLFHWSVIWMVYRTEGRDQWYTPLHFLGNVGIIVSMYLSFAMFPEFSDQNPSYIGLYLWVGIVGGLYLLDEVLETLVLGRQLERRTLLCYSLLGGSGIVLYLVIGLLDVPTNGSLAYAFIALVFLLSMFLLYVYRTYLRRRY